MSLTDPSTSTGGTNNNGDDVARMRRNQMLAIAILVIFVFAGAGFGFWRWQSMRAPDEQLMDPPVGRFGGGQMVRAPSRHAMVCDERVPATRRSPGKP